MSRKTNNLKKRIRVLEQQLASEKSMATITSMRLRTAIQTADELKRKRDPKEGSIVLFYSRDSHFSEQYHISVTIDLRSLRKMIMKETDHRFRSASYISQRCALVFEKELRELINDVFMPGCGMT